MLVVQTHQQGKFLQLFYSFQQLPKYSEFMQHDVLSWLQEFYITTFFFSTCNFLLQLLLSIAQNVKVRFKKHVLKLFQYSSILFDDRFELNNDLKAIVEMTGPNKQSRTVGQIVKLPRNFIHCGAKFQHATQTFGK